MSIEVTNIGQQLTAMDRRLESSVNATLRNTSETLKTKEATDQAQTERQNEQKAIEFIDQLKGISSMFDRKLQFSLSKELGKVVVKVIDSNTDKVIREIPSAEIQKLQIRIKETLGLLFDESI
jgi:flagellar protein FlaG